MLTLDTCGLDGQRLVISHPQSTEISFARLLFQHYYQNKQKLPLESWEYTEALLIGSLRVALRNMRTNVAMGKLIATGPIATTPVPLNVRVSSVTIPLDTSIAVNGIQCHGKPVSGEWIDYYPCTGLGERVVLYVHGGAYIISSRRTHRAITWRMAKYSHARLLCIDYRLAPEHTFPCALFDVLSSYGYLLQLGYSPSQISFAGDSAGGGLATACMLWIRDTGHYPQPSCVACFSPWLDLTLSLPSWHLNEPYCYLPTCIDDPNYVSDTRTNLYVEHDKDLFNPYVSPVFGSESEKPIPPMCIHIGAAERPRDDAIYFALEKFKTSQIRLEMYQDMVHVFQLFTTFSRFSKHSIMRMGQFVSEHSGRNPKTTLARQFSFVHHAHGYPIEPVPDCHDILNDGVDALVEAGIWTRDKHDDDELISEKLPLQHLERERIRQKGKWTVW